MLTKVHRQGPTFSRIIAGAWRWNTLSARAMDTVIQKALDLGITTFDHADIYGDYTNERLFGDALKRNSSLAARVQVVTKCGIKLLSSKHPEHRIKHYDSSRDHIINSVDNSLNLLGVEKLDLLLLHRPDPLMDVEQVAEAFGQLKQHGKVLHFGVSNFSAAQFDLLQSALSFSLVANQIELSLFRHQPFFDGTLEHLYRNQVSPMAWSPLGGGSLLDETTPEGKSLREQAQSLQEKYDATLPQLLLAWLLKHPSGVFPVVGTGKPERLAEAASAVTIELERQDWFEMLRWARGTDVP